MDNNNADNNNDTLYVLTYTTAADEVHTRVFDDIDAALDALNALEADCECVFHVHVYNSVQREYVFSHALALTDASSGSGSNDDDYNTEGTHDDEDDESISVVSSGSAASE